MAPGMGQAQVKVWLHLTGLPWPPSTAAGRRYSTPGKQTVQPGSQTWRTRCWYKLCWSPSWPPPSIKPVQVVMEQPAVSQPSAQPMGTLYNMQMQENYKDKHVQNDPARRQTGPRRPAFVSTSTRARTVQVLVFFLKPTGCNNTQTWMFIRCAPQRSHLVRKGSDTTTGSPPESKRFIDPNIQIMWL